MPKQSPLLLLTVSLVGITPKIWRELVVPSTATFFDLHVWLQDAMGWQDGHLHQFWTTNPYGNAARGTIISYPYPYDEPENIQRDERKERLDAWFTAPKKKMWYEYDFGDGWIHEVVLKKILPPEKGASVPRVTAGARACPPEDAGGIGGYEEKCAIIADKHHPEHDHIIEWLAWIGMKGYDPEKFDPSTVKFADPKKILRDYKEGFGV